MPSISDLTNKKVVVLGFGQEGQAIADYLLNKGVTPEIYDGKDLSQWKTSNLAKLKQLNLTVVCDVNFVDLAMAKADVLFRSPGVRISEEQNKTAKEKNLLITSQTQWFFEHSPAKIIGITGTKGKGTTASLLYEMLVDESKSKNIYLTGNIGKIQPFEFIDILSADDLVVYELSSFQLQDLHQSPHVGVCLMVTSDHLDYHNDLSEYHSAKSAITAFQSENDILIYNADYEATKQIASKGQGQKWAISKTKSESLPQIWINETDEEIVITNPEKESFKLDTSNRLLKGKHNLENIAAASAVALSQSVPVSKIEKVVNSFSGLKHRLQFVEETNGVKYFNDSVSTNPDTTIAAIRSFTEPIVLIVGGAVKNLDYSRLVQEITKTPNIKSLVTMGPAGKILADLLKENNFQKPVHGPFTNFLEVVDKAKLSSSKGDIVLLSPGATSFDMFNSYTERGDEFIKLVTN